MNKITKALSWEISSKLLSQVISLVTTMVLSRILTPEDFGLSAIIFAVSSLLYGFVNFGFSSALIQIKEVNNIHVSSVQWLNILLGIIFGLLFYAIAPFVASWYGKSSLLVPLQLFSFSFVFGSLSMARIAMVERAMKFKMLFWVFFISTIVSNVIGVIFALNDFGVLSLVVMHISNEIMRAFVVRICQRERYGYKFSLSVLRKLTEFGVKIMISGTLNSTYNRVDMLVMGGYFSPTYIGNYYRAKSLRVLVIRFVVDSLGKVLYSSFSNNHNLGQKNKHLLNKWLMTTNLISVLGAIFFASFAKEIVALLFGRQWHDTHRFFALFSLGITLMPIHTLLVTFLNSKGNADYTLKVSLWEKIGLTVALIIAVWFESLELYIVLDAIVRSVVIFIMVINGKELRPLGLIDTMLPFLFLFGLCVLTVIFSLVDFKLIYRGLWACGIFIIIAFKYNLVSNIKAIFYE